MRYRILSILALVLAFPLTANAHKMWLLPSQTVLSGSEPLVTVDAAISNDLFYFNHYPLSLEKLVITAPDGTAVEAENKAKGRYRSVFDVSLRQQGTYQITVPMFSILASWEENGERRHWRGSVDDFATKVPADAQNLQVTESIGRIDTFVTNGAPSDQAIQPSDKGIDLVPITHPNDLYAGEQARFRLVVDGAPTAGLNVEIIRGGTRYRDSQEAVQVTTDTNGEFAVDWKEPGMYWLETSTLDDKAEFARAEKRRLSYTVTLEVLQQ